MGPIWGRQDSGGAHVGPMNLAIWGAMYADSFVVVALLVLSTHLAKLMKGVNSLLLENQMIADEVTLMDMDKVGKYLVKQSTIKMATEIWFNVVSGKGLLPYGTEPLPEFIIKFVLRHSQEMLMNSIRIDL